MARSTTKEITGASAPLPVFAGDGSYALPNYLIDWDATLQILADPFDPTDLYFLPQSVNDTHDAAVVNVRVPEGPF